MSDTVGMGEEAWPCADGRDAAQGRRHGVSAGLTPTTENTERTETRHWIFSVISVANVICLDSN